MGQAVIASDLAGRITYWNHSAEVLYGWPAAEAVGRRILDVRPYHSTQEQAVEIFQHVQAGETWTGQSQARSRDGRVFPALVAHSPVRSAEGAVVGLLAVSTDITELKQRERELEAIALVSTQLRAARSRTAMLPILLDSLRDLFRADGASLIRLDAAAGEWVYELGRGSLAGRPGVRYPAQSGLSGQVLASGQLYVTENISADANYLKVVDIPDGTAAACAPLITDGKIIGVFWINRRAVITPAEARLFTAVADIAANALQRATLHEQTERRLRQLQTLRAIDQAIISSLDLTGTLESLLKNVTEHLGADAARVTMINPQTRLPELAVTRGFQSPPEAHPDGGPIRQAQETRSAIHIPNLAEAGPEAGFAADLSREGFVDYYLAPLVAKGHVRGALEFFQRAPVTRDEDWHAFVEALADQTSIAVDNAQLFDDLQRTNVDLAAGLRCHH